MSSNTATNRRVRKPLNHSVHFHGRVGATYFITICCQRRGVNQLCLKDVASVLFETARRYHASLQWHLKLLLLMPDHLHMLIGVPADARLSNLIRDFNGSRPELRTSPGSGTFSIIDCAMMRARMRK
jgi:REP element-mobilizing transposase RayT